MRFFGILGLVSALVLVAYQPSNADTLVIDESLGPAADGPKRGSSMTLVKQQFGAPQGQSGPVGDPPITTWTYPTFTVYFEFETVLHSVAKR